MTEVAKVMLAPSNVASQMRPDLDPAEAADRYVTDGHARVPADVLQDALVYLEYANASYYIEVQACIRLKAIIRSAFCPLQDCSMCTKGSHADGLSVSLDGLNRPVSRPDAVASLPMGTDAPAALHLQSAL